MALLSQTLLQLAPQFGVKGLNGGRLQDVTVGLNWFLNPNMKVQWNYSATDRQSITPSHTGLIQGFGMRVAHDF